MSGPEDFLIEKGIENMYDTAKDNINQAGEDIHQGNYLDAAQHGTHALMDAVVPGYALADTVAQDVTSWVTHAFGDDHAAVAGDQAGATAMPPAAAEPAGMVMSAEDYEYPTEGDNPEYA